MGYSWKGFWYCSNQGSFYGQNLLTVVWRRGRCTVNGKMPQIPKTPRESHFIATLLFCWFLFRFAFTVISNDCPETVSKDGIVLWVHIQNTGGETNLNATFPAVDNIPCVSPVARVFPLEISPHWVSEEPQGLVPRSREDMWRESLKMKTAVVYYNFKIM